MRVSATLTRLAFLGLLFWLAAPAAWAQSYRLAVVPQLSPLTVHKAWAPFLKALSHETGFTFELLVYRDIPQFEADLMRGVPDFAYMNPYHQVMARERQGYVPLVRSGVDSLVGILVVRRDSPIKSIKDLQGKRIAFPAPNAFGSSLYMRALLAREGGIRFRSVYLDTHSDVFRHVLLEQVDAGGAVTATLRREPAHMRQALRVLFQTPSTAPHPLSAHPRVAEKNRERVRKAILTLASKPENAQLFKAVQLTEPQAADYRRDYAPLERLGLGDYVVPSAP